MEVYNILLVLLRSLSSSGYVVLLGHVKFIFDWVCFNLQSYIKNLNKIKQTTYNGIIRRSFLINNVQNSRTVPTRITFALWSKMYATVYGNKRW